MVKLLTYIERLIINFFPNFTIIETKISSGRFHFSYPFTIDLNKIQKEHKVDERLNSAV